MVLEGFDQTRHHDTGNDMMEESEPQDLGALFLPTINVRVFGP